jgi:hypothetical protein
MTSAFETARRELEVNLPAVVRMYAIEMTLRKSDLGRWMPERAHELARQAAGIPDHVSLGREPLDESEDEWLRSYGLN